MPPLAQAVREFVARHTRIGASAMRDPSDEGIAAGTAQRVERTDGVTHGEQDGWPILFSRMARLSWRHCDTRGMPLLKIV